MLRSPWGLNRANRWLSRCPAERGSDLEANENKALERSSTQRMPVTPLSNPAVNIRQIAPSCKAFLPDRARTAHDSVD